MYKKNYIITILLLLFIYMTNVSADNLGVLLTNVEIIDKSSDVKSNIIDYKNLNVNLNTILFQKDDYIKYKIAIKNTSDGSITIDKITDDFTSDVISTSYEFETKKINKNEEYSFDMVIKCNKDIDEEKIEFDKPINIIIKYDDGNVSNINLVPKAKDDIVYYFILLISSTIIILVTKKYKKIYLGLIITLCLVPITTNAIENTNKITMNNIIKVYGNIATVENGLDVNKKIKELVGDELGENASYLVADTKIKKIIKASSLPDDFIITVENTISSENSKVPIYIWFKDDILYYYNESEKLLLGDDSRFLFANLRSLDELDASLFDTSNVSNMYAMFYNCINIQNLNLSKFDTTNVENMSQMFRNCIAIDELDLSNFDTTNVTNMSHMFRNCSSLDELNISNFNTSNVENMSYMFRDCSSLDALNLSSFDTSNVTNMMYMFTNCKELTSLDVTNFDTSKVVNFDSTFRDCRNLTSIDLSNFSIESSVITRGMFYDCVNLKELDLTSFHTDNEIDMSWMFRGCSNLEKVIFDTSKKIKLIDINHMFCLCPKIDNIDLTGFDTSRVQDMRYIFYKCNNLKNIDLTNYDTSSATSMQGMFYQCEGLKELDLSNFNTSNVEDMSNMFGKSTALEKIFVGDDFITDNVTVSSNMFYGNNNLVGQNGTAYTNSHRDKSYARLDKEELPGYFSYK